MQGLNPLTMQCTYSTLCGWCAKWDKKCDKKIGNDNWFTPKIEDYITKILAMFQANQYVCSICGKIISPKVEFDADGKVDIAVDKAEARGGLGNKIIHGNICPECAKRMEFR